MGLSLPPCLWCTTARDRLMMCGSVSGRSGYAHVCTCMHSVSITNLTVVRAF